MQPNTTGDMRNMIIALALSSIVLIAWQVFYTTPKLEAENQARAIAEQRAIANGETASVSINLSDLAAANVESGSIFKDRKQAMQATQRITIKSEQLLGSISLKGARIDDLRLQKYHQELDKTSELVTLLSPSGTKDSYFAEVSWISNDKNITLPSKNTVWQSSSSSLTPTSPVILSWVSPENIKFEQIISLDENFMFTIEQKVTNGSSLEVKVAPYGLINRSYIPDGDKFFILHEGPLGVTNGELQEFTYSELQEDGDEIADESGNNGKIKITNDNSNGWLGISDKYWLTAIIPDKNSSFKANYQYYNHNTQNKYQTDFVAGLVSIKPSSGHNYTTRIYAGAKKLKILDEYAQKYNIPLFDRAVDFGVLYFLTRPLFEALNYFYKLLGNFGLAILLLTVVIKAFLYPLASKSYKSMAGMKAVMPKMQEIREKYSDDKMQMNKEIMALYKKEKINPASGCLPMIVQIPIFFALYKVLFVTIEMRHAPFYGWIKDLSLADPTNIFTLFGLVDWNAPSFMHVGILPLLMSVSMMIQQKLNPKPADKAQATMMAWLPWVFLFIFSSFPAGLVLYWVWNNILSIAQQWVITRRIVKQ